MDGLGLGIGMGLTQGYSSGGSQNSGSSWSMTDATSARSWSEQQAALSFERQKELMQMQMDYNSAEAALARKFNSEEAQKGRDWQSNMANTVYTRSVKNMIEAGINPILAANMGLSGANVGSAPTASAAGASASMGTAPLAQNFMDAASGSQSQGSSYSRSESGLATALEAMGTMISAALGAIGAGQTLNIVLKDLTGSDSPVQDFKGGLKTIKDLFNGDADVLDLIKDSVGQNGIDTPKENEKNKPDYSWGDRKDTWYNPMMPFTVRKNK